MFSFQPPRSRSSIKVKCHIYRSKWLLKEKCFIHKTLLFNLAILFSISVKCTCVKVYLPRLCNNFPLSYLLPHRRSVCCLLTTLIMVFLTAIWTCKVNKEVATTQRQPAPGRKACKSDPHAHRNAEQGGCRQPHRRLCRESRSHAVARLPHSVYTRK